jgi:hypothetical protein
MSARGSTNRPRFVEVPIQPHLLLFWAYNLIYLLPLVGIYLYGYVDTGAVGQIGLDSQSIRSIWLVYAEGLIAFSLGSIFVSLVLGHLRTFNVNGEYRIPNIGITEKLGILLIAAIFIAAKAALIPLGVYHQYAFTDLEFKNSIWSFSTVCSEFVLLAATLLLFSDARRNLLGFAILSLLNCVNLLHGTRIFFVVNLLVLVVYAYMRGLLSLRQVIIFGPPAFVAVLLLAYAVFMSRSGVTNDGLNAANTVSPLVYESLFSQISLRNVVNSSDIVNSTGSFPSFVSDVVLSLMPRVIVPDKDTLQYLERFAYMSPFGAFNGYAAGLIYFGVYWPIFYLVLGGAASWLHAKSRTNAYWLVLYVYFTGDVLFRFMRDGYTIPIKILFNIIELLAILLMVRALMRGLPRPTLRA